VPRGKLIPVPNLDDRDWRAIRDAMVARIPDRCPEWTNHNPSDPGITLIEVFALEVEQLIYRLNQVLGKHIREYLNMIGVTLTPASSAKADEFFKLSARQSFDVTIPSGFEVGTPGSSGQEPVVFTTDDGFVIHAALLHRCLGWQGSAFSDFTTEANSGAGTFNPLPGTLVAGDALYLAFRESNFFEKATFTVQTARSGTLAGVWEYWRGNADGTFEWAALEIEDDTDTFAQTGDVSFVLPGDWEPCEVDGVRGSWLRFRVTSAGTGAAFATLSKVEIDEIWGRVPVSNAARVASEVLGSSDESEDQRFFLANVPVLDITLQVDEGTGFESWEEVDDFSGSRAGDKHYLLNRGTGEVRFGDGRTGKVPARGLDNVKAAPYRYGGGLRGNVGEGTITVLRNTQAYVDSCTNKAPATGGGDEETVEQAVERGPVEQLKTRDRAVTAEDYETLVLEGCTGVSRVKALPLFDPANPTQNIAGVVSVVAMPAGGGDLSQAMKDAIREYLDDRRLVTAQLYVISPAYETVDVSVSVTRSRLASRTDVETRVQAAIAEFLDPETGGDAEKAAAYALDSSAERGDGWPFGRSIYLSELYELVERIEGVDHVDSISVPTGTVALQKHGLPVPGTISVSVS
jgi:uncharacterized phage protein gp47/JayE